MFSTESPMHDAKRQQIRQICTLAIAQDEDGLDTLVRQGIYLFPSVNLDDPLFTLANTGEHDAVDLLLKKYEGNPNRAAKGYGVCGNEKKCREMMARGASVDTVVWGLKWGGHDLIAEKFLPLISDEDFRRLGIVRGQSMQGNATIPTEWLERQPELLEAQAKCLAACNHHQNVAALYKQHGDDIIIPIIEGYIYAGNLEKAIYYLRLLASPCNLIVIICRLANDFYVEQVNAIIEQQKKDGIEIKVINDLILHAVCGYARGGHLDQLMQLYAQVTDSHMREGILKIAILESAGNGHYAHVRNLLTLQASLGIGTNAFAVYGYARFFHPRALAQSLTPGEGLGCFTEGLADAGKNTELMQMGTCIDTHFAHANLDIFLLTQTIPFHQLCTISKIIMFNLDGTKILTRALRHDFVKNKHLPHHALTSYSAIAGHALMGQVEEVSPLIAAEDKTDDKEHKINLAVTCCRVGKVFEFIEPVRLLALTDNIPLRRKLLDIVDEQIDKVALFKTASRINHIMREYKLSFNVATALEKPGVFAWMCCWLTLENKVFSIPAELLLNISIKLTSLTEQETLRLLDRVKGKIGWQPRVFKLREALTEQSHDQTAYHLVRPH